MPQFIGPPQGTYGYDPGMGQNIGALAQGLQQIIKAKQDADYRRAAEEEVKKGKARKSMKYGPQGWEIGYETVEEEEFDFGKANEEIEFRATMDKLRKQYGGETTTMPVTPNTQQPQPINPSVTENTPQPGMIPLDTRKPEPFIKIEDGVDKYGITQYKTVKNPEYEQYEKEQTSKLDARIKSRDAQRMQTSNALTSFRSFRQLAEELAGAFKEGSAGSAYKKLGAKAKLTGFMGESIQTEAKNAAAYDPGKVTEAVAKFMPQLTSQGDKAGSVRLVTTVFDKLSKSFPGLENAAAVDEQMIGASIDNVYGFYSVVRDMGINKVVENLGIDGERISSMDDKTVDAIADSLLPSILQYGIQLSPEQEAEKQAIKNEVLEPITRVRAERAGFKWKDVLDTAEIHNIPPIEVLKELGVEY